MRLITALAALGSLVFAAGCFDVPLDDWERGRKHGPGYYRSQTHRSPGYSHRDTEQVEFIPGTAPTTGTTNIYYGTYYPNGYAAPAYTSGYGGYGYGNGHHHHRGSNWGVQATGNYHGTNYGVGYGSNGGYGYANGQSGNTKWKASYGHPQNGYAASGSGYGGNNSYGIYGNGNRQPVRRTPSRFSVYR